jgi:hypothetical protein
MTVERWDDDRLDRFGAFIEQGFAQVRQLTESNAKAIQALRDDIGEQGFAQVRQLTKSNAKAIQALSDNIGEQGFAQVRQLTESNAKAIQAFSDDIVEYKLTTEAKMEQNEARMRQIEEAMLRLDRVAEGLINITVAIDDDRPTMLRKLNSIENKVDRILQKQREDRES